MAADMGLYFKRWMARRDAVDEHIARLAAVAGAHGCSEEQIHMLCAAVRDRVEQAIVGHMATEVLSRLINAKQ